MNSVYLYRQILKGKWFIHYSYALSLGVLLDDLLSGKQMTGQRDWNQAQTVDLSGVSDRAKFPVMAGTSLGSVSIFESFDEAPEGSVAIIPLMNVMIKHGTMCEYGTEEIAAAMLQAAGSKNIDAILLDIDSGGGSVDSIPPMLDAIEKIHTMYNKPVVAWADLCASAAYYVAAHCDRIIAGNNLSSEFGSIGVMMQFADMRPRYEAQGIKFHKIYAPESNYKNLPFELALEGKYDMIKEEELSPLARTFQEAVKTKRGSKLKLEVEGLLNGRMFYASNGRDSSLDAKAVGLIDEIGSLERAIMMAQSLAEVRKFLSNKL